MDDSLFKCPSEWDDHGISSEAYPKGNRLICIVSKS